MRLIYVIDEPMGRGKTSAAINYINSHEDTLFLVVTPYLKEVKKYTDSCKGKDFKTPTWENGTKLNNIKTLINNGENIVTTHALFQRFDLELIDLLSVMKYTLIMDEVANVVDFYDLTQDDQKNLMEKYIKVEEGTNLVRWKEEYSGYTGKFSEIKGMCELGALALYSEKGESDVVIWLFPIEAFKAFKNVFIMTYLFNAQMQRYYYDYYSIHYERLYINGDCLENYRFSDVKEYNDQDYIDYKSLIHVLDNNRLNEIGDDPYTLSKAWFSKAKNSVLVKELKNNTYNFFYHYTEGKASENIWTTFKDYKNLTSGKGYTKGFLECNARATNEYRDRTNVAYLINLYMNPIIYNFFNMHGVEVDQDGYALSEMLQFIWRSAIRDQKPINVYVPSKRMRGLLMDWINKNSVSGKTEEETENI